MLTSNTIAPKLCLLGILLFSCIMTFGQITQVFVTDAVFKHPESAVYDEQREAVYISNMDKDTPEDSLFTDYISKVSLSGEVLDLRWVKGISSPTGLAIHDGFLFAVERNGVAKIDIESASVVERYPIPATGFLNDITISAEGIVYISETSDFGKIYQISEGQASLWIEDTLLGKPNGLLAVDDGLIVGVNINHKLKILHIPTKRIYELAELGEGNIDGIQQNGDSFLVSHFMGNLYSIGENGVTELLNTRGQDQFMADFCFIPSQQLLIIPSLRTNKVYGYRLEN